VKKSVTLILLALFVLNMVGYYGVFVGLKFSSEIAIREQFDAESYTNEEVTIKVPIAIPYAADSKDYERVDGEFEHNGEFYRLVKQKLQSDTLFIVCIKDKQAQKMNQALADYVKTFTDKPVSSKQSTKTLNSFCKDYLSTTTVVETISTGWDLSATPSKLITDFYLFDFNQSITQPPEA